MGLQKTVEIDQVLLLRSETSEMFGRALWAAFEEVRRLYTVDGEWLEVPLAGGGSASVRAEFKEHYLSPLVPAELKATSTITDEERLAPLWQAREGQATTDQRVLGELVHELIAPRGTELIVTDLELVPPPEWRYVIWDIVPSGAVVSLAPLDPAYWGSVTGEDRERAATVKARVRAACSSIVGSLLGLGRCENDGCYLFADVDSVVRLDEMVHVGPEHGVEQLAYRGFEAGESDPTKPRSIVATKGYES